MIDRAYRYCLVTLTAGMALLGTTMQASAQQQVLHFDDLVPTSVGVHMPDEYEGLRWQTSAWYYMRVASAPENTFLALGSTATAVVSIGGAEFYFDGAEFWSRRAADANGRFYFILYRDGAVVYDGRSAEDGRKVFTNVHQEFSPGYAGLVDGFAVVFDQGGDDWDHLAMDNVRIRTVTPPPACPGDTNGDLAVNGADLSVLLASFGKSVEAGSGADFNSDGSVDGADLSVLLSRFGTSC